MAQRQSPRPSTSAGRACTGRWDLRVSESRINSFDGIGIGGELFGLSLVFQDATAPMPYQGGSRTGRPG
jgi:hypothetical protein